MDVVYSIAEYAANLFDALVAIVFFIVILGKNDRIKSRPCFYLVCAGFVVVLSFFQDISGNALVTLVCMVVFDLLFEKLFLKGKFGVKLYFNVLFHMILMLTNMLAVYGISGLSGVELSTLVSMGSSIRLITLIIHKITLLFVLMLMFFFHKRKQFEYQEWLIGVLMYMGALLTGVVIINITKTRHLTDTEEVQLILVAFGLLAICISVSICIYKLNRQYHYKLENQILTMRLEEEAYMMKKIEAMYEDNRILRHDLKHYLAVAQGMLHAEGIEETSAYLEEVMNTRFDGEQIYHTDSSVVNTVLNNKADICRKNDIRFEVRSNGMIGEEKQIDIGIILSNLIDNAIEAELQEDVRSIEVEIAKCNKALLLKVVNYISQSVLAENPELYTEKKDKGNHGIGIKSVKKLVKKWKGVYFCEEEENAFVARILLPEHVNGA